MKASTTAMPPRLHFGLEVTDVEQSRAFYEIFLNAAPTKVRPGYVKFEPQSPSINLSLTENPEARPAAVAGAGHFGIEVPSGALVLEAQERLERAGYSVRTEDDVTCCYAVQDKVWVSDPDGNRWEVYVVKSDSASFGEPRKEGEAERTCCGPECCT